MNEKFDLHPIFSSIDQATKALIELKTSFLRLPSVEAHNGDIAYALYSSQSIGYSIGEIDVSPVVGGINSCFGDVVVGHNSVTFLGGWIFNPFAQQMNLKNYFDYIKLLINPIHRSYPNIKFSIFLDNYIYYCPEKIEIVFLTAKSVFGDLLVTYEHPNAPIRFSMTKFSEIEKNIANLTSVNVYFNPIKQTLAEHYRTPHHFPPPNICRILNQQAQKNEFRFTIEDMTLPYPLGYTVEQLECLFNQCGVASAKLDFAMNPYNLDRRSVQALVGGYTRLHLEKCRENSNNISCQSLFNATNALQYILDEKKAPQSTKLNLLSIIFGPIGNEELREQYCKMRQEPPLLLTFQHVLLWTFLELLFSHMQYGMGNYANARCNSKKDFLYYSAKTGEYIIWVMLRGMINFAFIMGIFSQAYSPVALALVIFSYFSSVILCQEKVRSSRYFQHPSDQAALRVAMTLYSIGTALLTQFAACDTIAGILRILIGLVATIGIIALFEAPKSIYRKVFESQNNNETIPIFNNIKVPTSRSLSFGKFFKHWGLATQEAIGSHYAAIQSCFRKKINYNLVP